jgi:hypothetical protein
MRGLDEDETDLTVTLQGEFAQRCEYARWRTFMMDLIKEMAGPDARYWNDIEDIPIELRKNKAFADFEKWIQEISSLTVEERIKALDAGFSELRARQHRSEKGWGSFLLRFKEAFPQLTANASISMLHLEEHKKRMVGGVLTCVITALFCSVLALVVDSDSAKQISWTIALTGLFACLLLLDYSVLRFRIRTGLFGNKESDARELVALVLRNRERLGDDDEGRRVFEDAAAPERSTSIAAGHRPEEAH